MEKVCEFCMASMPVVYCQADVAHLCLSCDAKVHSANALSHRHLRTLLCYSCRCSPACTHCLDHKMYVCKICDRRLHNGSSQHRKCILRSYMGCPSANELAMMWNMDLSRPSGNAQVEALVSSALATSVSSVSSFAYRKSVKVSQRGRQQQSSFLILQQILDLKRLQLSERNESPPVLRDQANSFVSKSCLTTDWTREDTGPDLQTHPGLSTERGGWGEPPDPKLAETCPSPFSQLESLPSSSTAITSLPGETFWQLRSPQSNQFWSQNMEDIGSCEEFFHGADLDIPDLDMTFHNFEEVFQGEEGSMMELPGEETPCSFANIDASAAASDDGQTNVTGQATSRDATVLQGDAMSNQAKTDWGNNESFNSLRPNFPTMFLSLSRLSSESITNDCSVGSDPLPSNAGDSSRLCDDTVADHPRPEKRTQAVPRRGRTAMRKRVRGKSSELEGYNSGNASTARNC